MPLSDNTIRRGLSELRLRLPAGWSADLASDDVSNTPNHLKIVAPDQKSGKLLLQTKQHLEPRNVGALAATFSATTSAESALVIAPYLSAAVQERLREAGLAFIDLTGNMRIAMRKPGLFIETHGADVDPDRKARQSRTLRGVKAGRVVRALIDSKKLLGVRELAKYAGVDAGYVSRIVALLDREALVERKGHGAIVKIDWQRLLRRWAEEAPLNSRGTQTLCLEPRGFSALFERLKKSRVRYAVTGSLVAVQIAPVAPTRLAVLYVEDARQAISELGLRVAESGVNVLLIEPEDSAILERTAERDGLSGVTTSQAAVDLLTSPGRGPAEGEALIEWMIKNEEAWRG